MEKENSLLVILAIIITQTTETKCFGVKEQGKLAKKIDIDQQRPRFIEPSTAFL